MEKLSIRPLSADLAEKARNELNEDPKTVFQTVETLRSWLSKQPHIIARTDDQFLIAFLRGCKYSLERAKKKIDMYYTVRSAIPEFYQIRDICNPKIQEVLKLEVTMPLLSAVEHTGCRVWLVKPGAYDPSKVALLDVVNVSSLIADAQFWDDNVMVVCGLVIIVDLQGLSLEHICQYNLSLGKKVLSTIQEAYPIRLKGVHFINALPMFEVWFKLFLKVMGNRLKNRILLHESLDALHQHINKELLPTEYGGSGGSMESFTVYLNEKLMQRRNWLIEDGKYKTNESKRLGEPKASENLFGMVGSFTALDFD